LAGWLGGLLVEDELLELEDELALEDDEFELTLLESSSLMGWLDTAGVSRLSCARASGGNLRS
jgi:hypothetical protein